MFKPATGDGTNFEPEVPQEPTPRHFQRDPQRDHSLLDGISGPEHGADFLRRDGFAVNRPEPAEVRQARDALGIGELRGWRIGLEEKPENANAFCGVIALCFGLGFLMLFLPFDPIKALLWSAVLNGVIAVPLMVATMIVASSRGYLGPFVAPLGLKIFGWLATVVITTSGGPSITKARFSRAS